MGRECSSHHTVTFFFFSFMREKKVGVGFLLSNYFDCTSRTVLSKGSFSFFVWNLIRCFLRKMQIFWMRAWFISEQEKRNDRLFFFLCTLQEKKKRPDLFFFFNGKRRWRRKGTAACLLLGAFSFFSLFFFYIPG